MISGPIESHPEMSQRKRAIIHKMNVAGEKYLKKENKFRRGGCMPEDRLHMETMKNFWTCMKTAFDDFTCDTCGKKNDKHESNKCK